MTAFNFAMAFAMDNATIEHPADLRKINFKKLFGIENLRKHELAIRLEHPIDIKTQIKNFIIGNFEYDGADNCWRVK